MTGKSPEHDPDAAPDRNTDEPDPPADEETRAGVYPPPETAADEMD